MRADAARNRERLLDAAASVFAEHGLDVGVAEIARRAGVGTGTLFRHFATKDDLVAAIVERKIDLLMDQAQRAVGNADAWAGLIDFLTVSARMHAEDRGLMQAIHHRVLATAALTPCRARLLAMVSDLVERAQAQGKLRPDFAPADVPFLLSAVAGAGDAFPQAGPDIWRRYLALAIDGMRAEAATPLPVAPPSGDVVVNTSGAAPASAPPRS